MRVINAKNETGCVRESACRRPRKWRKFKVFSTPHTCFLELPKMPIFGNPRTMFAVKTERLLGFDMGSLGGHYRGRASVKRSQSQATP